MAYWDCHCMSDIAVTDESPSQRASYAEKNAGQSYAVSLLVYSDSEQINYQSFPSLCELCAETKYEPNSNVSKLMQLVLHKI